MNSQQCVPLKDFLEGRTQPEVAPLLGVTQGAISHMLKSERKIYVENLPDGSFQAYEIKPIGKRPVCSESSKKN